MSLQARVLRAMFWVAVASHSAKAITFLSQLILARLLTPGTYGIIAIAFVVLTAMQIFQDIGLGQTLVARQEKSDQAANAAFFMSAAMGLCLTGVLAFALAPAIAFFFGDDALGPVLRLMSVRLLFSSLGTVPAALLQKDLQFKTLAWPRLCGALGFGLVSLILAIQGLGAWSVAWASVTQAAVETLVVWLLAAWRPAWTFNRALAMELFHYSKHLVTISLGTFIQSNLDTITVGKVLGAAPLGHYNLAFTLANALPLLVVSTTAPVLLPAYSEIQDQQQRLANAHVRMLKYTLLLLLPAVLIVGLLARDIVTAFYGPAWDKTIEPLQILCIYALVRQLAGTNGPILLVTKRVKQYNLIVLVSVLFLAAFAWPATHFGGLTGMSILMVSTASIGCVWTLAVNSRTLGNPIARYLKPMWQATAAAIFATLVLLAFSHFSGLSVLDQSVGHLPANTLILTTKAAILLAAYTVVVYVSDREIRSDIGQFGSHVIGHGLAWRMLRR